MNWTYKGPLPIKILGYIYAHTPHEVILRILVFHCVLNELRKKYATLKAELSMGRLDQARKYKPEPGPNPKII